MKGKHIAIPRLALASFSLLVALLLAEVIARIAAPLPANLRFKQDLTELRKMQLHSGASILENDPDLFWRLKPNNKLPAESWPFFGIISNGQSLREDHDISLEKRQNELRILCLGDSCTFGYGVAHDECFVNLTEKLLQKRLPERRIECINAGVPGYSVFQGWRYLSTEGIELKPDLLILNFGWNDKSQWDALSDFEHYAMMKAMTPPAMLKRSRLCQLLWAAKYRGLKGNIDKHESARTETRPRLLPDESLEILKQIQKFAYERNMPIIVLFWPSREKAETDDAPEPAPEDSIALDLLPVIQPLVRDHGIEKVYFDDGHITSLAHKAVAEAIVDKLTPWLAAETGGK